jgi:PAS domain S-box-containing protein
MPETRIGKLAPHFYRTLLDGMSEGVCLVGRDGRILYANAAEEAMFGAETQGLTDAFLFDFIAEPAGPSVQLLAEVMSTLDRSGVWSGEWLGRRRSGDVFPLRTKISLIAYEGESCWLCVHEDVTAERAAAEMLRDREMRLELATEAAKLGVWDWDLVQNTFVYSRRAREICGFTSDQPVTHQDVVSVTHPEDYPYTSAQAARALDPAMRSETPYTYRIVRRDGSIRWVVAHGRAQFETRDGVERAVRYVGTLQDVTEQHEHDDAYAEAAQRLQLALEASRMAVWEVNFVTGELVASPDLNRLFGLPPTTTPDLATVQACYWPGEQERLAAVGQAAIERGDRYIEAEYRIVRPDGEPRWHALRCEVLRSRQGRPVKAVGVVADVTKRKATELRDGVLAELISRTRDIEDPEEVSYVAAEVLGRALGVSRAGYGTIDTAAETITIAKDWNAPGIKTLAGTLHFRDYGSYIEDLKRGETVVFADAEKDPRTAGTAAALKAISAQSIVNMPVTEQGGFVALLYLNHETARPWTPAELSLIREVAEHTRIAVERRRVERDLRALTNELERRVEEALAERSLLAEIVENTDARVQVLDPDYRWMAINRPAAEEFERIYGRRPQVGLKLWDLLDDHADHIPAIRALWDRAFSGETFTEVQEFGLFDRRVYEMKFNPLNNRAGERIGAFVFVYDVTARRDAERRLAQTEEALRQAQKMEAIGQITGGVAHDFNNLLTPIVGGLDMLQRRMGGDERAQRILAGAIASAERAQTLVQRLLAFSRRQPLQPAAVDLARLVDGMQELIASTCGPRVRLFVDVSEDLPPARADANQLEMALLNLAVNARDAMPDGGTLRIRAHTLNVDESCPLELGPGRYVRLVVEDTGVGMDEATLQRAVEPFFSTKGIGRGTGLGLSMVHGLAAQLGGVLRLQSRVGDGTTVELYLPVSPEMPLEPADAVQKPVGAHQGVALLAEDEELVRASTSEMLRELGYRVIEVQSADEALKRVRGGLIPDVVITDHLMPGLTGAELARALRREKPHLPVLVITGYANLEGIPVDIARLTKPFRQSDLARSLAVLTGAAP